MLALYTPVSQRRWGSFKIIRYFCIYCNEMKVDAAQSGCIFVTYNENSAHSTHAWIQLNGVFTNKTSCGFSNCQLTCYRHIETAER